MHIRRVAFNNNTILMEEVIKTIGSQTQISCVFNLTIMRRTEKFQLFQILFLSLNTDSLGRL